MLNLLQRLNSLDSTLTMLESSSLPTPVFSGRSRTFLRRLILPGSLLRFPAENDWNEFKEKFSIEQDAYELVQHIDPLGFSGDNPIYYDEESNPANYLKRKQLPPLRVEMSSIYNPSVKGDYPSPTRVEFKTEITESEPFLGSLGVGGSEFPAVKFGMYNGSMIPFPGRMVSSLTPELWNCPEALAFAHPHYAGGGIVSVIVNVCNQNLGDRYNPIMSHIIARPNISTPVSQDEDLSRPTLGCFWFNNQKQIALPKDPHCRVCVIVRFKKYLLL